MKRYIFFVLLCLGCSDMRSQLISGGSYLITNINLIPMTADTVLKNKMVLIQDGKIISIQDSINNPGVSEWDGQGKFMMPGLIDMHVHLQDKKELGLYLSNGITTIRNLHGMPWHLKVRDQIKQGKILGPNLFTTSPQLGGPTEKDAIRKKVKTIAQAQKVVKKYKNQGYDFIKTYNSLPPNIFKAIIRSALQENISIVAHPSFEVDYSFHFQKGISTIEHTEDIVQQALDFKLDSIKLDTIITQFAQSKVFHCPTLSIFYRIVQMVQLGEDILETKNATYLNPFMRKRAKKELDFYINYISEKPKAKQGILKQHQFHIEIIRRMHKARIPLVCGTDAGILFNPPGFSIHDELAFYIEVGMSNFEALQTATVVAAQAHEAFNSFGSIEQGKIANLVIIEENPLEHIGTLKRPTVLFLNGQIIHRQKLDQFLEAALNRKNKVSTWLRYGFFVIGGK